MSISAQVAGQEKEGEFATIKSLEIEYLYQKSRCKMLNGGDDIRNVMFFNFFYIADWQKSDSSVHREPQGN